MLPARNLAHAQKPISVFRATPNDAAALRGTLRAGGKGFLIEPPQTVADGGVIEVMASENGSRVIVLRQYYRPTPDLLLSDANSANPYPLLPKPVSGEATITVWNAFTRKASVVWRQRIETNTVFSFYFCGTLRSPSGDRILVNTLTKAEADTASYHGLLMIDTERGTVRPVAVGADFGTVNPSPRLPFAALTGAVRAASGLRFLRANGSQTPALVLPESVRWTEWSAGGTQFLGVHFSGTEGGIQTRWYAADPQTGVLTTLSEPHEGSTISIFPTPETIDALKLITLPEMFHGLSSTSVWLTSQESDNPADKNAVLLSAEGTPVFLLPRAALYLVNGALFAAPIQTVRGEDLAAIERKQSRAKTGRTAKAIGLALFEYMLENNENFPASASGLSADIAGHLRDPQLLSGFIYTPPTPLNYAGMNKPYEMVLGFLPGVGGKSVVYADGHVKWEDAP